MTERKKAQQSEQQTYRVERTILTPMKIGEPLGEARYEIGAVVTADDFPSHVNIGDLIACGALSSDSGPDAAPQAAPDPAAVGQGAEPESGTGDAA